MTCGDQIDEVGFILTEHDFSRILHASLLVHVLYIYAIKLFK